MNPHARPERGKNALYKYLSPFVNASAADPSIVTLTKDRLYGDILLLCSDGISSSDQVTVGNDPEGQTWILHEAPVTKLLTFLRQLLLEREAPAEGDLQKGLERCLKELPLDDDATVAILVTDKAVDHARNIANSRRP
jgi:serine/threonine protein phosphatase PrpC